MQSFANLHVLIHSRINLHFTAHNPGISSGGQERVAQIAQRGNDHACAIGFVPEQFCRFKEFGEAVEIGLYCLGIIRSKVFLREAAAIEQCAGGSLP